MFLFTATLISCESYEYLHSAQGSDYQAFTSNARPDTLVIGIEGGFLWGEGFNNSDVQNRTDYLNYAWAQLSGTKNTRLVDIGIGAKIFQGRYQENRTVVRINQGGDNEYTVANPFNGSLNLRGLTGGLDLSLLPFGGHNRRIRLIGLSYRATIDDGAYGHLRLELDPILNDNGSNALYTYQRRWLHSLGLYQDFIITTSDLIQIRFGHQLSGAPLGLPRNLGVAGGWSMYFSITAHRCTALLQLSGTENSHVALSLKYTF